MLCLACVGQNNCASLNCSVILFYSLMAPFFVGIIHSLTGLFSFFLVFATVLLSDPSQNPCPFLMARRQNTHTGVRWPDVGRRGRPVIPSEYSIASFPLPVILFPKNKYFLKFFLGIPVKMKFGESCKFCNSGKFCSIKKVKKKPGINPR